MQKLQQTTTTPKDISTGTPLVWDKIITWITTIHMIIIMHHASGDFTGRRYPLIIIIHIIQTATGIPMIPFTGDLIFTWDLSGIRSGCMSPMECHSGGLTITIPTTQICTGIPEVHTAGELAWDGDTLVGLELGGQPVVLSGLGGERRVQDQGGPDHHAEHRRHSKRQVQIHPRRGRKRPRPDPAYG